MPRTFGRIIAGGFALFNLIFGLWAFFAPLSFFEQIANFPPYNKHLLHDVGAFQIGIGATLLIALVVADALAAALAGGAVGAIFHEIAHVVDRDLGGRSTDPLGLAVVAALVLAAALVTIRSRRAS